jgi:raffinose/stachyose/melibiose transport system permease protein
MEQAWTDRRAAAVPRPAPRPATGPVGRGKRWTPAGLLLGSVAIVVFAVVFLVPFAFILVTALKTQKDSNLLEFSWPKHIALFDNIAQVIQSRDHMLVTAFINSTILTVASVTVLVIFGSMVAFTLQRRRSRLNPLVNLMVLCGLIIPPAVVPTIWMLQDLHLFKTLFGLILIEMAFGLSFTVVLYRAFIATIPMELDEAATLDGAGPLQLYFRVVFLLLRPVTVTNIVVQSVAIFNDFANPLYFLPGNDNATVQLTLFNFQSQFSSQYNLLFTDILLITVPPLIMFIFFNRQIVRGLSSGAVKG